jgi:hypothetical protein
MLSRLFPLSNPVQSIFYALITKSVGSGFRVWEDSRYRPNQLQGTLKREGVLLGLTTVVTTGVQMLFTKVLSSTLQKKPGLSQHELLLRALVTAPALIFAEWVSRELSPKNDKRDSRRSLAIEHEFWNGRPINTSFGPAGFETAQAGLNSLPPGNFKGGMAINGKHLNGKHLNGKTLNGSLIGPPQSFQPFGFYGSRV